jgi:hypothetical protein
MGGVSHSRRFGTAAIQGQGREIPFGIHQIVGESSSKGEPSAEETAEEKKDVNIEMIMYV